MQPSANDVSLTPVGVIRSPFREKFGIPRQPGILAEIPATLELLPPFNRDEAVRGLEGFSHVWLIFGFHACPPFDGSLTVRPPRLGGNKRLGVFATRGTHRPNPLGLSVVRLVGISREGGLHLEIAGADLLDGTPVYDIKPYLPYADSLPDADGSYATEPPPAQMPVRFAEGVEDSITQLEADRPRLRTLIEGVLAQDPRPAFKAKEESDRIYGVTLYDCNVRWQVTEGVALVLSVEVAG